MPVSVSVCADTFVCVYIWRSEDNSQELILSFYLHRLKGSEAQTQVVRLGGKYLYKLIYSVVPYTFLIFYMFYRHPVP